MIPGGSAEQRDGQLETLDDLSGAVHYNRWIFDMMSPYLGDRVLEVGCGIGNMTDLLARDRQVLAVDVHEGYLSQARKKYGTRTSVRFERLDLADGLTRLSSFKPDTIVCVNVFEHLEDDAAFLRESAGLLPAGGRLLLFVPALPFLFGSMDVHYGHFRRYYKKDLAALVGSGGF